MRNGSKKVAQLNSKRTFRNSLVSMLAGGAFLATAIVGQPAQADACTTGGDGSAGNPFVICTPGDLQAMSSNVSSDHYVLGADIDLSHTIWSSFDLQGELDGAGHSISNMHVIDDHGSNTGLFNTMRQGSYVKRLFVKDAEVRVYYDGYAGILAGYDYGTIDQVKVTGNIYTDSQYSSGLVGSVFGGSITNVDARANVITTTNTGYAAGITPFAEGEVGMPPLTEATVATSLFTGTIHTNAPIGTVMSSMPAWDINGNNMPMPTCSMAHQLYSVDSAFENPSDDRACGPNEMDMNTNQMSSDTSNHLSVSDLKTVTQADPRFSGYSNSIWDFGSATTFPHLVIFPEAPDQPGVATVTHSSGSVGITFVAPSYNGGSAITGYDVQVMPVGGTVWSGVGITETPTTGALTGLPNDGAKYLFRYRAVNAYGVSEWAPVSNTDFASTTPSAVGSVRVTSAKKAVKITFTSSTNNGGAPVTQYKVRFFKKANATAAWKTLTVTKLTATLAKLTAKTKLWVSVAPVNRDGIGAWSTKFAVTVKK